MFWQTIGTRLEAKSRFANHQKKQRITCRLLENDINRNKMSFLVTHNK